MFTDVLKEAIQQAQLDKLVQLVFNHYTLKLDTDILNHYKSQGTFLMWINLFEKPDIEKAQGICAVTATISGTAVFSYGNYQQIENHVSKKLMPHTMMLLNNYDR